MVHQESENVVVEGYPKDWVHVVLHLGPEGEMYIDTLGNSELDRQVFKDNYTVLCKDFFEHLLNCLANQKFLPLIQDQHGYEIDNQNAIDITWCKGMDSLQKNFNSSEAIKLRRLNKS